MFSEWIESPDFPGTKVRCRPFTGPQMLDLQYHGMKGEAVYDAVRFTVIDWEHIPLLGKDKFAESFDPALVQHIRPDVALWVVMEVSRRMSSVSEDERKN